MEQSKFLKEVERDKKQGDTEAASAGARVLRYYLEFSRDAKKIQKVGVHYTGLLMSHKYFWMQYAKGKKTLAPPPSTFHMPLDSPETRRRSKSK